MLMRIAGVFALVWFFSAACAEATLIDSFGAGSDGVSQSLIVWSGYQSDSSQVNPETGIAIGGYRDMALQWESGGPAFADVLVTGGAGSFSFTQGTAQGNTTLTWDGANTPNVLSYALNTDITDGGVENGFVMNVAEITGTGLTFTVTVYTDATDYSRFSGTLPGGLSGDQALPFSSFTQGGAGPATFANVGAIVFNIDGAGRSGSDITINSIRTANIEVPEPSAIALAMIAAMLFGVRWRRKKT